MKKKHLSIVIALAMLPLSSCMSKFGHYTFYIDYSRYIADGFFVTDAPSLHTGYSPVGSVSVIELSGYGETVLKQTRQDSDPVYDDLPVPKKKKDTYKGKEWIYASPQTALDAAVKFAREQGADALVGVEFKTGLHKGHAVSVTVSGMAVKREP